MEGVREVVLLYSIAVGALDIVERAVDKFELFSWMLSSLGKTWDGLASYFNFDDENCESKEKGIYLPSTFCVRHTNSFILLPNSASA